MMKKAEKMIENKTMSEIPTIVLNSDVFECQEGTTRNTVLCLPGRISRIRPAVHVVILRCIVYSDSDCGERLNNDSTMCPRK